MRHLRFAVLPALFGFAAAAFAQAPAPQSPTILPGEEAVKLGLADGTGNLDFVAREIVKAPEIIDYTRRDNVAERLVKRFGAAMGEGAWKAMRSATAIR